MKSVWRIAKTAKTVPFTDSLTPQARLFVFRKMKKKPRAMSRRDREIDARGGKGDGQSIAWCGEGRATARGRRYRSRAFGARAEDARGARGAVPSRRLDAPRRRGPKSQPESPAHGGGRAQPRRRAFRRRVSEARKAASERASRGKHRGHLRSVRSSAVADRRASLRALDTARSLDRVRATARPGGRDLSSEAPTARGGAPGRGAWTHLRVRVFAVWLTPVDLPMQERCLRAHLKPRVRVRALVCAARRGGERSSGVDAPSGKTNAPPRKSPEWAKDCQPLLSGGNFG